MNQIDNRNNSLFVSGRSQSEREPEQLASDYFLVDDRTLGDFVDFAINYSQLLTHFNSQNNIDGNFSNFFANDATVQLINLQHYNIDRLKFKFREIKKEVNQTNSEKSLTKHLKSLIQLQLSVLHDFERSKNILSKYPEFRTKFDKIIKSKLGLFLNSIIVIENQLIQKSQNLKPYFNYSIEFGYEWFEEYPLISNSETLKDEFNTTSALKVLDELFYTLIDEVKLIKELANNYIEKKVFTGGNIQPHIGLFIAFVDLYQLASSKLNGITERHLLYYYQNILDQNLVSAQPDKAHLVLKLNDSESKTFFKKGLQFIGGVGESGKEILYESIEDSTIGNGEITKFVDYQFKNKQSKKIELGNPEINLEAYQIALNPLLSNEKVFNDDDFPEFGLCLSSSALKLEEGDRRVKFNFTIQENSFINFKRALSTELGERPLAKEINKLLKRSFVISYSIDGGWHELDPSLIDSIFPPKVNKDISNVLSISCLINRVSPPTAVTLETDFSKSIEKNLPVFRIQLSKEGIDLYPYLNLLRFSKVSIDVKVLELNNLILHNDYGPLDTGAPFEPFGPSPVVGNNLFIGHPSLFFSPLQYLKLNFRWSGLPNTDEGFGDHYNGYGFIKGNDSFKVVISGLYKKRWYPEGDRQLIDLFRDSEGDTKSISPVRRMNEIDLTSIKLDQKINLIEPNVEYSPDATDGFLKLELISPEIAFGHSLYPELIKESALKSVKGKKLQLPPNEPYTPTLSSISVDYGSIEEYNLIEGEGLILYRVHPNGIEQVTLNNSELNLIPSITRGGEFHLGFSNLQQGVLNLLFQLNSQNLNIKGLDANIEWSILNGNNWEVLSKNNIVKDGTDKFKKSGIVTFNLPDFNTSIQSNWDSSLKWIKCASLEGENISNSILDVYSQAIEVTCINPEVKNIANLSAHSIENANFNMKNLSSINHPYDSFGGQTKEGITEFKSRISERIRHKDRAFSSLDFENILLQRFSKISKVKCLRHVNSKFDIIPGNVLITVIPSFNVKNELTYFTYSELQEIKQFLINKVGIGVEIEVVNPKFELVRLKFNVRFKKGVDENLHLKKLNKEICAFISPSLYGNNQDINLGEHFHSSTLLSFIENKPYVDHIINFSPFHIVDDVIINYNDAKTNAVDIVPTLINSMLVSASKHEIQLYNEDEMTDTPGINEMIVGSDFIVEESIDHIDTGLNFLTVGKNFKIEEIERKESEKNITFKLSIKIGSLDGGKE